MFSEHLTHHVESVRKEKQKEEDANKNLTNKLTQLQLSELSTKQKKGKVQAPVITVEQAQVPVTATMAPQSPGLGLGLNQMGASYEPQLPLHCTLMYDEMQSHTDYKECWEELINKKPFYMVS